MNILKLTNPGTKVAWKTIPLVRISGNVRFMRDFFGHLGHVLKGLSIVDQLYKLMGLTYMENTRGSFYLLLQLMQMVIYSPLYLQLLRRNHRIVGLGFLLH